MRPFPLALRVRFRPRRRPEPRRRHADAGAARRARRPHAGRCAGSEPAAAQRPAAPLSRSPRRRTPRTCASPGARTIDIEVLEATDSDHAQRGRHAVRRGFPGQQQRRAAGAQPERHPDRRRGADRDLPLRRADRARPLPPDDRLYAARSTPRRPACSRSIIPPTAARRSARSSPSSRRRTRAASSPAGTSPISARPTISASPSRRASRRSATCRRRGGRGNADGTATVTFQTTPAMSSYLLFLAVGELDRITTQRGGRRGRRRHPARRRRAGPLGAGERGPDPALVQPVFRHALSRCPSSTMSPARAPASSSARWRIGARSSPSRISCSSIRRSPPRRGGRRSSRSPRTKWRTNGSAISSPWPGGTISG